MCHVFKLSLSGYYRWCTAPLSSRQMERENLKGRIRGIFAKHNGMVGSPIVSADIHDDPAFSKVSRPRVARLMREMGLKCGTVKKFVVTTDSKHNEPVAPNLLDRKFAVSSPDQVWVSEVLPDCFSGSVFSARRWLGSRRFPRKTFSDPSPEEVDFTAPSRPLVNGSQ